MPFPSILAHALVALLVLGALYALDSTDLDLRASGRACLLVRTGTVLALIITLGAAALLVLGS